MTLSNAYFTSPSRSQRPLDIQTDPAILEVFYCLRFLEEVPAHREHKNFFRLLVDLTTEANWEDGHPVRQSLPSKIIQPHLSKPQAVGGITLALIPYLQSPSAAQIPTTLADVQGLQLLHIMQKV